jgi:hypothetical protein
MDYLPWLERFKSRPDEVVRAMRPIKRLSSGELAGVQAGLTER